MITGWSSFGARPAGARLERARQSPQFDDARGRFVNALPAIQPRIGPLLRDWIKGAPGTTPEQPPPLFPSTLETLARAPEDDLRVTWLGHSTLLVELEGAVLLVDPVWGERASPWSFMGPARFHRPPLALDELPPLDAVVISHDHYD
ncbi:MAG: MBL fold metallo-hydrolase, partial [Myxococcales bacterium]|nr:MBL fold metallo-hydrolase [Myxococcales bacterium]